jgi:hypothetical protein
MKTNKLILVLGAGALLYLLVKPKMAKAVPTNPVPVPPVNKPDCAQYGKVNCQVINSTNGQPMESCCCPEGLELCGLADHPIGGAPLPIDTKCYDPKAAYAVNPCNGQNI